MNQSRQVPFGRYQLDNGLVLLTAENHRLPLVSVTAFVRAGVDQNPLRWPGLAALTSRLLDEGTTRHDHLQIANMIEDTGGSIGSFCERELSGLSLSLTSEYTEPMLDLLGEMLTTPVFPQDRFELERVKALSQLSAFADDPQVVASNRLLKWIYPKSPLGYPTLGTAKSLEKIGVEDLKRFYRHKFSPANTILVLVGDIDESRVRSAVSQQFSDWENPCLCLEEPLVPQRQKTPIQDEFFMEKEQLTILLGHLGVSRTNPDYHALQVMDIVLGSGPGFTSRIPKKLRDEQGLAYSVFSSISNSCGLQPGVFLAAITTSPHNREAALDGLIGEIRQLVAEGITAQELETAQHYLTGSFVFEFQSNSNLVQFLLATELFGLGQDYPERYAGLISNVSREDVHRVASQYLDTLNYTTVVVGPIHDRDSRNP